MSKCLYEIEAVQRIRLAYPNTGQRTLARLIVEQQHPERQTVCHHWPRMRVITQEVINDCIRLHRCSYATIYNRIRRIDGSIK